MEGNDNMDNNYKGRFSTSTKQSEEVFRLISQEIKEFSADSTLCRNNDIIIFQSNIDFMGIYEPWTILIEHAPNFNSFRVKMIKQRWELFEINEETKSFKPAFSDDCWNDVYNAIVSTGFASSIPEAVFRYFEPTGKIREDLVRYSDLENYLYNLFKNTYGAALSDNPEKSKECIVYTLFEGKKNR